MYHRRRKKSFVAWMPVILAGILIIAVFAFAPSLRPSPPRGALARDSDPRRPSESASGAERPPTTATGLDGVFSNRRAPAPEATAVPVGAGARKPPQAGERRAPAPEAMAAASTDAGARKISHAGERREESPTATTTRAKRRAPDSARAAPEPQDDASADLSVRWNQ